MRFSLLHRVPVRLDTAGPLLPEYFLGRQRGFVSQRFRFRAVSWNGSVHRSSGIVAGVSVDGLCAGVSANPANGLGRRIRLVQRETPGYAGEAAEV